MTGVASSAAIYTMYHYVKESPDVEWCAEMRHDELKTNPYTEERARAHTQNSFFRWVGNLRDRTVSRGPARVCAWSVMTFNVRQDSRPCSFHSPFPALPASGSRRAKCQGHAHLAHLSPPHPRLLGLRPFLMDARLEGTPCTTQQRLSALACSPAAMAVPRSSLALLDTDSP